ncbi:hypothetical protein Pmar_PMAR009599, partial [Perkinsus marinus ATCC 50983]
MTSTTTSPLGDNLLDDHRCKEEDSYGADLTTTSNSDIDHLPVSVFGSEPPGTPPINPTIAPPESSSNYLTTDGDTVPAQ